MGIAISRFFYFSISLSANEVMNKADICVCTQICNEIIVGNWTGDTHTCYA